MNEMNVSENRKASYFNSIDAVGIEHVFVLSDAHHNNNLCGPDGERIELLRVVISHGENGFWIEYLREDNLIERYLQWAQENGLVS